MTDKALITAIAGETSGDQLAASILYNVQTKRDVQINGIGGKHLKDMGQLQWFDCHNLAVRGYVEALPALKRILHIRKHILHQLKHEPPNLYFGIDAADFNLHIEQYAYKLGIPVVHFISPSIWAWRAQRIHKIKRAVNHMLCLFPFEAEIYHKAGIAATYVGHPMASKIDMHLDVAPARQILNMRATCKTVALLPGSRKSEIRYLLPTFLHVAYLLQKQYGDSNIQFVLPIASQHVHHEIMHTIQNFKNTLAPKLNIELNLTLTDSSYLALQSCDSVLVASGTATLEAALHKKPMLIAYQVPWLTAQIMKHQGYLPYVGLPNILAGKFIVREYLQNDASVSKLFAGMLDLLNKEHLNLIELFNNIHETLRKDTVNLSADVIMNYV
jgi:lipid-A-disaccharide synthase